MFKPTPQLYGRLRRLPLTTKQAGKGYYKGNRTGSMGRHTKHGKYVIDYGKVRTYCVPDLSKFPLTPFVATRIKQPRGSFDKSLFDDAKSEGKTVDEAEIGESDELAPASAEEERIDAETVQAPYERLGGRLDARRYLAVWRYQNTSEVEIAKGKRI